MKRGISITFLSFSRAFFYVTVSIWRQQESIFSFRAQLFAWNTLYLALINLLLFLVFNLKTHSWQKWNTSQLWRQELFIISLTETLNNLIKIQQTVILGPTTPFLSSYAPHSSSPLGPETMEVALSMRAAGLSKLSAASGLCRGGRSVFMEGGPTFLLSLCVPRRVSAGSQLMSRSSSRANLNRQKGTMVCCAMTPTVGQTWPQEAFTDLHLKQVTRWSFGCQPIVQTS